MSDDSPVVDPTPPSGIKSTELWSLLVVVVTNVILVLVTTGRLSKEVGDQLSGALSNIIQAVALIVNLYAWKWYAAFRTTLKQAHLSAHVETQKARLDKADSAS